MIPITPEILGPGIEEEYADALAAIDDMRVALRAQPLTNDTPEGRVLLNIEWVEQEIRAQLLPIPVDQSFVGTIFYLVGSNELANYPGFQDAIGRLWLVLKGYVESSTEGLRGWIGPAAPQMSSDGTMMLPGHGEQIWISSGGARPGMPKPTPWNPGG